MIQTLTNGCFGTKVVDNRGVKTYNYIHSTQCQYLLSDHSTNFINLIYCNSFRRRFKPSPLKFMQVER